LDQVIHLFNDILTMNSYIHTHSIKLSKVEAPIVNHAQQPTSRSAVIPLKVARYIQLKLRMCFFGPFQSWDYYGNDTCSIVVSGGSEKKQLGNDRNWKILDFGYGWNALFGLQNSQ